MARREVPVIDFSAPALKQADDVSAAKSCASPHFTGQMSYLTLYSTSKGQQGIFSCVFLTDDVDYSTTKTNPSFFA